MTLFAIIMFSTWLLAGMIILVVGFKAQRKTLPVNNFAGIRTRKLIASEDAWVKGHKAAANYLMIASLPLFIGAIVCLFADDSLIGIISIPVVVVMVGAILIASKKANNAV